MSEAPVPTVQRRLVLASGSPRRQALLRAAGFEFVVDPADVDEDDYPPRTPPAEVAVLLAGHKAQTVAARRPDDVILAADTVVALGDEIIGKPQDTPDAREIIRLLSGTTQVVITGVAVAVAATNHLRTARVMSAVRMRTLTAGEIERYVESGAWRGKAGGYGIQDPSPIVTLVGGCPTNVVGLPMKTTAAILAEVGIVPSKS